MHVSELWRYPIKSMLGERLEEADVGPLGVDGDRRRAVTDANSGVSLSAKRYAQLLSCRAWTTDGRVVIGFADGSECEADSAAAASALSELLDRPVVVRTASARRVVQHEFPTDIPTGEGEPFIWEPGLESFFDRASLHLITTATLDELADAQPGSAFTRDRFRPNILVQTDSHGFVEDSWVGEGLTIGAARFSVIDHKPRCVMTTRQQGQLPRDLDVLKTVASLNQGNAGIELNAQRSGVIRTGDPVSPFGLARENGSAD